MFRKLRVLILSLLLLLFTSSISLAATTANTTFTSGTTSNWPTETFVSGLTISNYNDQSSQNFSSLYAAGTSVNYWNLTTTGLATGDAEYDFTTGSSPINVTSGTDNWLIINVKVGAATGRDWNTYLDGDKPIINVARNATLNVLVNNPDVPNHIFYARGGSFINVESGANVNFYGTSSAAYASTLGLMTQYSGDDSLIVGTGNVGVYSGFVHLINGETAAPGSSGTPAASVVDCGKLDIDGGYVRISSLSGSTSTTALGENTTAEVTDGSLMCTAGGGNTSVSGLLLGGESVGVNGGIISAKNIIEDGQIQSPLSVENSVVENLDTYTFSGTTTTLDGTGLVVGDATVPYSDTVFTNSNGNTALEITEDSKLTVPANCSVKSSSTENNGDITVEDEATADLGSTINKGTINNEGDLTLGETTNNGNINNAGELTTTTGTEVTNAEDGTIFNTGTIAGPGTLVNSGKIYSTSAIDVEGVPYIPITQDNIPEKITLNQTGTVSLYQGNALNVTATVSPDTAIGDVEWTSTTPSYATVTPAGPTTGNLTNTSCTVTAVSPGLTTINASIGSVNASFRVNVLAATTVPAPTVTENTIIGVDLSSNGLMEFFNTTGDTVQSQPFTLDISGTGKQRNLFGPEQLSWTVSQVPSGTIGVPTFGSWADNGAPKTVPNANGRPGNYTTTGSRILRNSNSSAVGNWSITYNYTTTVTTNAAGVETVSFEYSDLELNYDGGSEAADQVTPGLYQLTAAVPEGSGYENTVITNVNGSTRFMVSDSEVENVDITRNGQTVTGAQTLDLSTGRYFPFGYIATNIDKEVVQGHVVEWTLQNPDNTANENSALPYATVNEQTGVVTVLSNPPAGTYFTLSVTVDGKLSNIILLTTTGSLNYDSVTGIKPVYNPVSLTNSTATFTLNDNVVQEPFEIPISDGSLSFSSSNPSIIVYPNTSTTPTTYQLVPVSAGITGSTTVTATWTNSGKTYTTTFDVNYVSSAVPATGLTAADSLTFVLTNAVSQNVNASLMPENNTEQAAALDGEGNGYAYESSNEGVAVVDQYGNVTPVSVGTCTITTTFGSFSATTEVTVNEAPETATAITVDPTTVYLVPEGEEGTASAEITATVTPENVDPNTVTWTADSENITLSETTGLTTTVSSTEEPGTYTVTASVPGPEGTTLTATCTVIVSDAPVVLDPMKTTITADSPDFYTVTVAPAVNPAVEGTDAETVQKVSIFTWSQVGQTDMDCKEANQNADGTWSYTFPVNNTPVNEYYIDASDITVQAYASTNGASDGNMIMNTTWNYADCGWTEEVIATPYVQDTGFITPSVGNGAVAGTTGEAKQMEGIRLSTPIEGVDIVYDVHVQNVGWMDQVSEGTYAGTMHENLQMEAIHISLTGANASQYAVQYQAHVQNIGWMDWVQNGAEAGTTGQGLQMEALRVQIVPAGTALPSNNA